MIRGQRAFKNALCLDLLPEGRGGEGWLGLGYRQKRCQRRSGHKPPHRSYAREWNDGDADSRPVSQKT